jgi:hypothetical protein
MKNSIETDHKNKLIIARVSGTIEKEAGIKHIAACRQKASEFGYNILHDIREMELHAGITDMYMMIKSLPELTDPVSKKTKVALLVDKSTPGVEKFLFYEMAGQNKGLLVKVFLQKEEALSWLK